MVARKGYPLRIDPALHEALQRWARDDLRSLNAQIEFLLRQALTQAKRLPREERGGARDARREPE